MVRRSSTTSRGTTYWFHCFCFPVSRLSIYLSIKNAQKQEEEVKQPNHFKQAKGLRHLKQGRGKMSEIHRVFVKGSVWVKNLKLSKICKKRF